MTDTAASSAPKSAARWVALGALLMAQFMNLIDVTIVNVALPSLQDSLGANDSQIEWVVAVYILTFALLLLTGGRLGDIFGRRNIFIVGVCVFTVGSALCGLAPGINTLVAARVVQGIGGALMVPQGLALVPNLFEGEERGAAFAAFGLVAGLATVTGPVLGGSLIALDLWGLDWRPIFLVNIPIGVLAILAALRFIPTVGRDRPRGLDYVGVLIAAVTLLSVLFPLIEGRQLGWPTWCFVLMCFAPVGGGLFYLWQRRRAKAQKPQLVPEVLFRNTNFMVGTGMVTILFAGMPGFFLTIAVMLQNGYGLTPLQSGLATLPFPVGVLTASLISGRLGTRWPRRRISIGALLLSGAMFWLHFAVPEAGKALDVGALRLPLLMGGFGLGTAVSPLFQTVLANVGGADTGSASGALQSFQQLGGSLGIAVMGQLFFSAIPMPGAEAGAYADAFRMALYFNTSSFLVVALIVWRLPRPESARG